MFQNSAKKRWTTKFMKHSLRGNIKIRPFGRENADFYQIWAQLSPAAWNCTLSPAVAQLISLSNWSANRAMTPNIR